MEQLWKAENMSEATKHSEKAEAIGMKQTFPNCHEFKIWPNYIHIW
jgi:hypothetical protein